MMERLPKLLLCSPMSQSNGIHVESSDRISNLPDHIAHYILSFLGMEDIARLNIVSKRWLELCISIPSLTFDVMPYSCRLDKKFHFMNFLDRFMHRRNGMKTQRFCIRWNFLTKSYEGYRVITWLHDAVRCNVEVLDLEFTIFNFEDFPIPLDVCKCESLRFLSVNLNGNSLLLPPGNGFAKLQYLLLKRVRISDQLFGENFLSCCKFLDKLCLDDVCGLKNINIMSSSLKYLEVRSYADLFHLNVSAELLQEFVILWKFPSSSGRSLKIVAPLLKSLTFDGYAPECYFLGNLKYLRYLGWSLVPLEWRNPHLVEFFCSIEGIEDLSIHVHCLKALCKGAFLPIQLNSLHTLDMYFSSMEEGLDDDIVPAIALLLKGLPNVQKLSIRYKDNPETEAFTGEKVRRSIATKTSGFNEKYWESQDLMFICQLKWVKMDLNRRATSNQVALLKYILEHATALEVVGIFFPPSSQSLRSYITMKLNKVKIAPNAKIYLYLKSFK